MGATQINIDAGHRWFAIQTKPRKEKEVAQRFQGLSLEVFLPWMRSRRRVGSRYQWVLVPLFPGYLFCHLDLVVSGKAARYTPGVKDFVKFGDRIAEVSTKIIQTLQERCPNGVAEIEEDYKGGEPVKIKEGPFAGLDAIFERKLKGSERVAVLLALLGRQTRVVVRGESIGKV